MAARTASDADHRATTAPMESRSLAAWPRTWLTMFFTSPAACPGSMVCDCLISQPNKLVRLSNPRSASKKMKGNKEKNT